MNRPDPIPSTPSTPSFASIVDTIAKIIGAVGIVAGGIWTYQQFTVQRVEAQNLIVSVSPNVVASETNTPVIIVDVALKNIGKVPIWAGKRDKHEGCELTVIEYENMAKGFDDDEDIKQGLIDWRRGGGNLSYLVRGYNMLNEYQAFQDKAYMLNPGAEYHERAVVPVKSGKLYGIRARFFSDRMWTAADFAYVYVPTKAKVK